MLKTYLSPRRIWRSHQLADGFENSLDLFVVSADAAFQFGQLIGQFLVASEQSPELNKGSNNIHAHLNRPGAIKNIRRHDGTVLGKGMGKVLKMLAAL